MFKQLSVESKLHNLGQQLWFVVEGSLLSRSGHVQPCKSRVAHVVMVCSMRHHLSEFSDPGLGVAKGTAFSRRMVVARAWGREERGAAVQWVQSFSCKMKKLWYNNAHMVNDTILYS